MHILKPEIVEMLRGYKKMTEDQGRLSVRVNDHTDVLATLYITEEAQTIIFPSELALSLVPAIRRFEEQLDFNLPFPAVIFQFSEEIPETDILTQEKDEPDQIQALIVSQTESGINNASVWFKSTATNRAQWENESVSPLRIAPTESEKTDIDLIFADNPVPAEIQLRNKEIIRLLAVAMVTYINCDNVELERHAVEEKINRKRASKGKKPLDPYYTCRISSVRYPSSEATPSGRTVGFMFAVRGHFRRLISGKTIWVHAHYRGVQHAAAGEKPKTYQVD